MMGISGSFERPTGGSGGFSELINPGEYPCKLVSVEEAELDVYNKPGEKEPGLVFNYEIPFDDGSVVTCARQIRRVLRSTGNTSLLYRDLKGMLGAALTDEVLEDDARVIKAIEHCVGKEWVMSVEVKKSDSSGKEYNKCTAVRAKGVKGKRGAPQADPPAEPAKAAPAETEGDVSYDDDDIPF